MPLLRISLALSLALLALGAPLRAQAAGPHPAKTLMDRVDAMGDTTSEAMRPLVEEAGRALEARPDPALAVRAAAMRCWMEVARVEADSIIALAQRAMDAAPDRESAAYADLRTCRGYGYEIAGRLDEATADYEAGVEAGRRLDAAPVLNTALMLRGEMRHYRGDLGGALADLLEAAERYERAKRPGRQRYVLNALANLYADRRMGEYDRALEYYRQVLAQHEAAGREREISTALFNIGKALETKGDFAAALPYYRRSLEIERRRKDPREAAEVERAIGQTETKLGRPAEGLRWLDASLAFSLREKDEITVAETRLARGTTLRLLGRTREALADLDASLAYFTANRSPRFLEKVQDERALAFAAAGDTARAYLARVEQLRLRAELDERAKAELSARLRAQFDSDKKDADNAALREENRLRGQALRDADRIRALQTAVITLIAAVAVALAVLVFRHVASARMLRAMAMTDELTRIANRRALLARADAAVARARAREEPLSVLALDVDRFKGINDAFGHHAGDVVLQRVADACQAALRQDDVIGRTGGEEFVVLLPGTGAAAAGEVAERLRAAVERLDWADVDPGLHVTVSIGVAERAAGDTAFAPLLKRADDSLYRAKETGRNRVELGAPA